MASMTTRNLIDQSEFRIALIRLSLRVLSGTVEAKWFTVQHIGGPTRNLCGMTLPRRNLSILSIYQSCSTDQIEGQWNTAISRGAGTATVKKMNTYIYSLFIPASGNIALQHGMQLTYVILIKHSKVKASPHVITAERDATQQMLNTAGSSCPKIIARQGSVKL